MPNTAGPYEKMLREIAEDRKANIQEKGTQMGPQTLTTAQFVELTKAAEEMRQWRLTYPAYHERDEDP